MQPEIFNICKPKTSLTHWYLKIKAHILSFLPTHQQTADDFGYMPEKTEELKSLIELALNLEKTNY